MIKLFPILFLLVCISQSYGQRGKAPSKITINGIVIDKETQQPLEYTTISLLSDKRPNQVQGGLTGANGKFSFSVFPGIYDIKIEYIGFEPYTLSKVELKASKDFGQISLLISENLLEGVEVMAEKTEVEIRLDKRIYNVGKDLTVRGGSVADVLDNVPSVSVDVEGNVALRGNDNVRILINGKPSGLVGISGPQGLQQLPAESIEKVEVITSPSARYGAEGTAGILNIILKKQELLGLNGNFTINGGFPRRYGGSATVNLRKEKFNIFTTNSTNNSLSIGKVFNDNEYFNGTDPSTFLEEIRRPERENNSIFSSLGVEIYLKEKTSLILGGFIRTEGGDDYTKNEIKEFDKNRLIITQSDRIELEEDDDKSHQFNINFDSELDEEGQKITATFQYEESDENESANIENSTLIPVKGKKSLEKLIEYQSEKRILFQADYVLPIDKETQFEFGYRGSFSNQGTDYNVYLFDNNQFNLDNNLSNELIYKEHINALYTQYGKKMKDFSFLFGLRMEDSKITVDQRSTNDYNQKNYTEFFPTVNLSYEFKETESIILGYSRRISRPRGRYLNPFPSRSSVANFFQGNADLNPSYSNTIDLGYLKRWDKFTLNGSVYFQKATSVFTFVGEESGETAVISGDLNNPNDPANPLVEVPIIIRNPINLAENNRTGVEFTLSYSPSRKSRFFANFNLYNSETIGEYKGESLDATNLSWFSRVNSKITLPGDIDWQMRVYYSGPRITAQSRSEPMLYVSGALSKDVFKDKGTISFRVSDLFNTGMRESVTTTNTFRNYGIYRRGTPTFILSATYRLNQKKEQKGSRQGNQGSGEQGGDVAF